MIHLNLCVSLQVAALDKLTSEQKAELFYQLEAADSLNSTTVDQIFQSLLQPFKNIVLNVSLASSTDSEKVRQAFYIQ